MTEHAAKQHRLNDYRDGLPYDAEMRFTPAPGMDPYEPFEPLVLPPWQQPQYGPRYDTIESMRVYVNPNLRIPAEPSTLELLGGGVVGLCAWWLLPGLIAGSTSAPAWLPAFAW